MIERMLFEGERLAASEVKAAEEKLGVSFPVDYVRFLLTHNGGRPEPEGFPMLNGVVGRVGNLYKITDVGTREKKLSDLVHRNRKRRNQLPVGFLEIGFDIGGNALLLGVCGKQEGAVFLLGREQHNGQPVEGRLQKVADSFDAFLRSLGGGGEGGRRE